VGAIEQAIQASRNRDAELARWLNADELKTNCKRYETDEKRLELLELGAYSS
jgi:hypothetical protein